MELSDWHQRVDFNRYEHQQDEVFEAPEEFEGTLGIGKYKQHEECCADKSYRRLARKYRRLGQFDSSYAHSFVVFDQLEDKIGNDPRAQKQYRIRGRYLLGHATHAGIISSAQHLSIHDSNISGVSYWQYKDEDKRSWLAEITKRNSISRRDKKRQVAGFSKWDMVRSQFARRTNWARPMKVLAAAVADSLQNRRLLNGWRRPRRYYCAGFSCTTMQAAHLCAELEDAFNVEKLSRKQLISRIYRLMRRKGTPIHAYVTSHPLGKLNARFTTPPEIAHACNQVSIFKKHGGHKLPKPLQPLVEEEA